MQSDRPRRLHAFINGKLTVNRLTNIVCKQMSGGRWSVGCFTTARLWSAVRWAVPPSLPRHALARSPACRGICNRLRVGTVYLLVIRRRYQMLLYRDTIVTIVCVCVRGGGHLTADY